MPGWLFTILRVKLLSLAFEGEGLVFAKPLLTSLNNKLLEKGLKTAISRLIDVKTVFDILTIIFSFTSTF